MTTKTLEPPSDSQTLVPRAAFNEASDLANNASSDVSTDIQIRERLTGGRSFKRARATLIE
jgi:hypothetical protein